MSPIFAVIITLSVVLGAAIAWHYYEKSVRKEENNKEENKTSSSLSRTMMMHQNFNNHIGRGF